MWIKICGIRDVTTAQRVAELSPDAIGFNFYAKSVRCVSDKLARQMTAELPPTIAAVGVFVNHEVTEITDRVTSCGLTMVQLHGDEPPEFLAALYQLLPAIPLIRAWRMGGDLADLSHYLAECQRLQVELFGCLIDAKIEGTYGGSGHTPPWNVLADKYAYRWPKLILAGGLTPDNVVAGIEAVQPWGVDVASGVESSPGIKDLARVQAFITHARPR